MVFHTANRALLEDKVKIESQVLSILKDKVKEQEQKEQIAEMKDVSFCSYQIPRYEW